MSTQKPDNLCEYGNAILETIPKVPGLVSFHGVVALTLTVHSLGLVYQLVYRHRLEVSSLA